MFLVIFFSKSSKSTWKVLGVGLTTTNFAPALPTKTLYSVKNGAMAIHSSSPLVINALRVIESDAAAPQVK